MPRFSTVAGIACRNWSRWADNPERLTRSSPHPTRREIVGLLKTGSAYYALPPAPAMAESYLKDQKRVLLCAVHVDDSMDPRSLCRPAGGIGDKGVERVVELHHRGRKPASTNPLKRSKA